MPERAERYLPPSTFCLVGIFGHCIAQIPYLLSMLIAQNCTKVLTFVTHRKLAFHMPHSCCHAVPGIASPPHLPATSTRFFASFSCNLLNYLMTSYRTYRTALPIMQLFVQCRLLPYPLPPPPAPTRYPAQLSWSGLFEWPSKNVFTIHCSTCLLWLTCRYSLRPRGAEGGGSTHGGSTM